MRADTKKRVIAAYKHLLDLTESLKFAAQGCTTHHAPEDFAAWILIRQVEDAIRAGDMVSKLGAVAQIAENEK
jgi:hypothetical protein